MKTKPKKKPQFITLRFRKGDPSHNLYAAVQHWVKANHGSLVVVGGIEVQDWQEGQYKYKIAIGCLGRAPTQSPAPSKKTHG